MKPGNLGTWKGPYEAHAVTIATPCQPGDFTMAVICHPTVTLLGVGRIAEIDYNTWRWYGAAERGGPATKPVERRGGRAP